MSLLDYFEDGFTPSKNQIEILNKIENSIADSLLSKLSNNKKKKFIIISAPTGSGKSFIAKTLSNYCNDLDPKLIEAVNSKSLKSLKTEELEPGGCFVLTISKSLQDQYHNLFMDASIFKGKSNYTCGLNSKLDCDIGACCGLPKIKRTCIIGDTCPYYNAMYNLYVSKLGVLNYASFFKLDEKFKRRQMLICDEASALEDELVNNFTLDITYKTLKYYNVSFDKLPLNADSKKIFDWVTILYDNISIQLSEVEEDIQNLKSGVEISKLTKYITKYKFLQNIQKTLCNINSGWNSCEYIRDGDDERVVLTPLYVKNLTKELFDYADTIILMSATIINHKKFAETLGIDEYDYIEADNLFDPKKAPIYIIKNNNINYKSLDTLMPKITNIVKHICDKHSNSKGIIHTHTNKITNYIKDNLNDSRLTVRHDNVTNEEILKIHKEKDNSILVSPSMAFGVDLKDDLARFQIVIKLPFLPLFNKRINILSTRDKDWYLMKMFTHLIQACGRGVRSVDDYCYTYILDSTLINLLINYSEYLPKYFTDRFQ